MGNGIELIRMTIYVFFPVVLFYYFNRPSYFNKLVEDNKERFYPEGVPTPRTADDLKKEYARVMEKKRKQREAEAQKDSVVT